MELVIVGAGVAGLAAARRLRELRPEIAIRIIEKSRGVGGRAATRRAHGAIFDHGAQYVKAPTLELAALLQQTLAHETLADIARPVWTFDGAGRIVEGDPAQNADPKWTYSDGLTRLSKELAHGLAISFETRLGRIARDGARYRLFDEHGGALGAADAVLFTPPAPQTHTLIAASDLPEAAKGALLAELARAVYRPCLTLTLGYPPTLRPQPFYALVNTDRQHAISWLAYEHLKPGRDTGDQHVLIVQMAPGWSADHWDDPLPALAATINAQIAALLGEELDAPRWADRQGWRYALPDAASDLAILNDAAPGLFFAGDFTAGQGRVHLAIEQGWQVAERIAAQSEHVVPD